MGSKVLTKHSINQQIVKAQYAVRGKLALQAEELAKKVELDANSQAFSKIIRCNIGNPQQLEQRPVTFFRQILSLLEWPELLDRLQDLENLYPKDVMGRAREICKSVGSIGAYSHSKGIPTVRQAISAFIEARDGFPSDPEHIFLTNGASDAIHRVLECIVASERVGIMIPIPQYPLYSAVITLVNGIPVPYYLDEQHNWSLKIEELERAHDEAKKQDIDVRAICIINPGNPTGNCFSSELLQEIILFCNRRNLVLLSDEVYQTNIYGTIPFTSAKKAACQLGERGQVEIFSFHSTSKGLIGECGHRAGYFECHNIDTEVLEQLYKLCSIFLCANVPGQVLMQLMVDPPKEGDESYELYCKETGEILASLHRRAEKLQAALASMRKVTCNPAAGAMYLFPKIDLPTRLVEHAASTESIADEFYALALLNATGICIVPGSGFGQAKGTFHVRTTFLPKEDEFDELIERWKLFHEAFMREWS